MSFSLSRWSRFESIKKVSKRALATILVPQCACCRQAHQSPERLCAACLSSLRANVCPGSMRLSNDPVVSRSNFGRYRIANTQKIAGVTHLQSAFFYRDVVPDLLIRWKYDGMVELTDLLASWVTDYCQLSHSYDLVTIIPCHWRRRFNRGFDHVWLLANTLAKTGLIEPPIRTLKHSKPLPFLHLQAASDRHIDPNHFRTVHPVKRKRVLVIDDVVTSGATLKAAAAALQQAGAVEVNALTVATAREPLLPASRTWI